MEELLNCLEYIEDARQQMKVRHKLKDIVAIILFTTLANADDCLGKYLELKNGIPSHDTINRVMGMLSQRYCSRCTENDRSF